uniref:Uncharacterized protein n=1 Tax=Panagrolaimus sp. JU765 TaxID=591449 RepID=A0AC34QY68_9BILA
MQVFQKRSSGSLHKSVCGSKSVGISLGSQREKTSQQSSIELPPRIFWPKFLPLPTGDFEDPMLDLGGYKRLGGKNGLFASRNTSYFVTLIVLVIFVFLFYLYNNASNDAANLRREINAQSEHIAKLKNEILEGNVNLEKARSGESACQNSKLAAEKKSNNDASVLNKLKAKISDLQASISEKEESIKSLKQELNDKSEKLEQNAARKSVMEQYGTNQEAVIIKLNETIELMKKDLALKDDVIHGLKQKLGSSLDQVNEARDVGTTKALEKTENVIPQPKESRKPQRPDEPEHLSAVEKVEDEKDVEENDGEKPHEEKEDADGNDEKEEKGADAKQETDPEAKEDKDAGANAKEDGEAKEEKDAGANEKEDGEAKEEKDAGANAKEDGEEKDGGAKENGDGEANEEKDVDAKDVDENVKVGAEKEGRKKKDEAAEADQDDTAKNVNGDRNVIRNPEARIKMEQAQQEDEKDDEDNEKGPLVNAAEKEKN